ncbi:MAG TPA: alanine--tRNA ligase [Chitinispirillaceae bacterium]|nr:alanine--tRNA ligase [Chitinispirillaceae bacterium]
MKSSKTIRNEFIGFFTERKHVFVPSAPVVPQDDPTLLFTNAGMNQFKSIFLGDNPRGLRRAANSQKCMRVSGKHNDLEEVGRDHYHHTFFEMLGNWSFGDYYKKEAICWAWELFTQVWKLPRERLFVTIHHSDDEAEAVWKTETDIAHERIMKFGDKSNFWEMGDTGPCGPCSEIHYDIGDLATQKETFSDPVKGVNGQNDRYRELWNLVFIQYNREKNGTLTPLPSKHVDTGMGFERIVSVIQGVTSNYDTDLFQPVISKIEQMSGTSYQKGPQGTPFRVIADHIRSLVFAITDGAFPSNEGRGYVLRRLLRRAARFGRELGFKEPFLFSLVPVLVNEMGEAFPEIAQRQTFVQEVIRAEEERFGATLEQGIEKFNQMVEVSKLKKTNTLSGADVFSLYDTYGFPMDLTRLMAAEQNLSVDEQGYAQLMEQQKERAREARKADDGLTPEGWIELRAISGTEFVGYVQDQIAVNVCRYKIVESENAELSYLLILDRTPFYAESGGQVGDTGIMMTTSGKQITVKDTFKWNDLIIHRTICTQPLTKSDFSAPINASIDTVLRQATRRNHSATHLIQAALRKVLGAHVQQSGSKVDSYGLRFDFTHFKALTIDEIRTVERMVNEWILRDVAVTTDIKDLKEAKAEGATALFGEKYADKVRVVSMGELSKELCGGTHISSTGQIGLLHITEETSISAGVRRITAITGLAVLDCLLNKEEKLSGLSNLLKSGEDKIHNKVENLLDTVRKLEDQVKKLSFVRISGVIDELFNQANKSKGAFPWITSGLGDLDKDSFARITDAVSDKIKSDNLVNVVVLLGASVDGKALFAASAGTEAVKKFGIHCGELVKAAAQLAGGGGGGSAVRAQAGGKDTSKLGLALEAASHIIELKAKIS